MLHSLISSPPHRAISPIIPCPGEKAFPGYTTCCIIAYFLHISLHEYYNGLSVSILPKHEAVNDKLNPIKVHKNLSHSTFMPYSLNKNTGFGKKLGNGVENKG